MSTTKEPEIERKDSVQRLQCVLTQSEILQYAKRMVGIRSSRLENEDQLDALKKEFNARIATLEAQESELALKIGTGKEWREVACTVTLDYASGDCYTVRDDTFEEIHRRPLTAEERQKKLPLEKE